ncbi:hypothetical protein N7456_009346 [Penicillium angulare]|uniref:Uncharacterized protein n=1 Tax=Penicillium angulare TaxID=116970 RepID=A0A9W9F4G4_9EURO|nr:hypothetical protein N7456_009346 [Penicillium angulare]
MSLKILLQGLVCFIIIADVVVSGSLTHIDIANGCQIIMILYDAFLLRIILCQKVNTGALEEDYTIYDNVVH